MADISISQLPSITPDSSAIIPFSQGGLTYGGTLSSLAAGSIFNSSSGTWLPFIDTTDGLSSPSITYTIRQGSYIKINNLCFINGWMRGTVTNTGGSTKQIFIFGIPFNAIDTYNTVSPISIGSCFGFNNNPRSLVVYGGFNSFRPNEARIYMWKWSSSNAAAAGTADMLATDLIVGGVFDLQFAGCFVGK